MYKEKSCHGVMETKVSPVEAIPRSNSSDRPRRRCPVSHAWRTLGAFGLLPICSFKTVRTWLILCTSIAAVVGSGYGIWLWMNTEELCGPGTYFFSARNLCVECPGGTYSEGYNSTTCTKCNVGYYCKDGSPLPTQYICPVGFYCPAGASDALPCPQGRYGNKTGSSSPNCTGPCSLRLGWFCDYASTLADDFSICPQGFYCNQLTPQPCPAGRYGSSLGLSDAECDGECPAGKYCQVGSASQNLSCPAGFYCPAGTTEPLDCQEGCWCPEGSSESCPNVCPAGSYCPAQSPDASALCPEGFGCPKGIPIICQAGHYCPQGSYSTQQYVCSKGFYCPAGSASPVPCPAGTYGTLNGQTTSAEGCDSPCPAKYYCPPGTDDESMPYCPAGYWCPDNTPGEYEVNNGTLVSFPDDSHRCPGGLRASRTHVGVLLGCYCNFTIYESSDSSCECPEGYYCPPGTTYDTVKGCTFNHYCSAGSSEPSLCTTKGYYCSRYASRPNYRVARFDLSLFSLSDSSTFSQNMTGVTNLASSYAHQEGISEEESLVYLRKAKLPVYQFQRGLSQIHFDVNSIGATAPGSTDEEGRTLMVCEVDNATGAVRAFWPILTFDALNITEDPEQYIGEVAYPIPRDFPASDVTLAICATFYSGSIGLRTTLSDRFQVQRGLSALRQWKIVSGILWTVGFFWAAFWCTRHLWSNRLNMPSKRKEREFERFRKYFSIYKPTKLTSLIGNIGLACEGPIAVWSWSTPPMYPSIMLICVYILVLGMLLLNFYETKIFQGTVPDRQLDMGAPIRNFILAPLLYEHLYAPTLSMLLFPSTSCSYDASKEFIDEILFNEEYQCWYSALHAFLAMSGLLLIFPFFEGALDHLIYRKPRMKRLAEPVIPRYDWLHLLCKTWVVVVQALANLSELGEAFAPVIAMLLYSIPLLLFHLLHQPFFGKPWSHRVNSMIAGNRAAQIFGALVTAIAVAVNGLWTVPYIICLTLCMLSSWCSMAYLNEQRSIWNTKKLKRRFIDSLAAEDVEVALAYAKEYGLASGFSYQVLESLGRIGQSEAAFTLEEQCLKAEKKHRRTSIHQNSASKTPLKISQYGFMLSAWKHSVEIRLPNCCIDEEAGSRLLSSLEHLPQVRYLDLRANRLSTKCIESFLANVLPTHVGLEAVDFRKNPALKVFSISPSQVICPLLARNTKLAKLYLGDIFIVYRELPHARPGAMEGIQKLRSERKFESRNPKLRDDRIADDCEAKTKDYSFVTCWIEIHRYQRSKSNCDWVYQLFCAFFGASEAKNIWFLHVSFGGGSKYEKNMLSETANVVRNVPNVETRLLSIETIRWNIDFSSQILRLYASSKVLIHKDDAGIILACVARMPNLLLLDLNEEALHNLGGFEFASALANNIQDQLCVVHLRQTYVVLPALSSAKCKLSLECLDIIEEIISGVQTSAIVDIRNFDFEVPQYSGRKSRFQNGHSFETSSHQEKGNARRNLARVENYEDQDRSIQRISASTKEYTNSDKPASKYETESDEENTDDEADESIRKLFPPMSLPLIVEDTPQHAAFVEAEKMRIIQATRFCPLYDAKTKTISKGIPSDREIWCAECNLGDEDMPILSCAFSSRADIAEVHLEGNSIGDKCIPELMNALFVKSKSQLRNLHFGSWNKGNRIRKKGALILAETLFGSPGPCELLCGLCAQCKEDCCKLTLLDLRHNQIGGGGCTDLLLKYPLRHLQILNLCSNNVGDVGATACAEMLCKNCHLKTIRLSHNRITAKGAHRLALALRVNTVLCELYLDWNDIRNEGCMTFSQSIPLARGLKTLTLENNNISDEGALSIGARGLGTLKELFLGNNKISDAGVLSIRDELKININLETLSLTGTQITQVAVGMFVQALESNARSSLSMLDLSKCSNITHRAREQLVKLQSLLVSRLATEETLQQHKLNPRNTGLFVFHET